MIFLSLPAYHTMPTDLGNFTHKWLLQLHLWEGIQFKYCARIQFSINSNDNKPKIEKIIYVCVCMYTYKCIYEKYEYISKISLEGNIRVASEKVC